MASKRIAIEFSYPKQVPGSLKRHCRHYFRTLPPRRLLGFLYQKSLGLYRHFWLYCSLRKQRYCLRLLAKCLPICRSRRRASKLGSSQGVHLFWTARLAAWERRRISYDDLIQLVLRAIDTPTVGFSVVYGVSNNDRAPVDNSKASFLGYRPKDNAEQFASEILAEAPIGDTSDPAQMHHGGPFAAVELGNSGLASMKIINDKKTT